MKLAVLAIGGNSLIRQRDRRSVEDQFAALCETMERVADVVASGWRVLITHGNGPQVNFILLRSDIARSVAGLHRVPLDSCVADTQGAIGYQIQQALEAALMRRGLAGRAATVVTRVLVDPADPAFQLAAEDDGKLVGDCYSAGECGIIAREYPAWTLREGPRGWQRVVPRPRPVEVVEMDAIRALLASGHHVVAGGGGGIPVLERDGALVGVEALVDKDLTSSLLASRLGADMLIISTGVEKVALNYGTPLETPLDTVSVDEMERYLAQGHFPRGNMGPKIRAAIDFVRQGGGRAVITSPDALGRALGNETGTHIVP